MLCSRREVESDRVGGNGVGNDVAGVLSPPGRAFSDSRQVLLEGGSARLWDSSEPAFRVSAESSLFSKLFGVPDFGAGVEGTVASCDIRRETGADESISSPGSEEKAPA